MYTIFIFPVQTERRGSGPSTRCLYNYVHLWHYWYDDKSM